VSIFSERSDSGTHYGWLIIENKGVVLHQNINICEVFVVGMALKDILSAFDALVDFAHVINYLDGTIFLQANEIWHAQFSIIDSEAEAN
jgi:hypothetical protein